MKKGKIIMLVTALSAVAAIILYMKSYPSREVKSSQVVSRAADQPVVASEKAAPVKVVPKASTPEKAASVKNPAKDAEPKESPQTISSLSTDELDQEMLNPTITEDDEEIKAFIAEDSVVDWDEAKKYPQLNPDRLLKDHKQIVQNAPVPVLLPEPDKLRNIGMMTIGNHWYASSMGDDEVTVLISGSSKAVRIPDEEVVEPPGFDNFKESLIRTDGIVEIDFKAFGTYYNLTVECYHPDKDPRCSEDNYAIELVGGLLMAGGKEF